MILIIFLICGSAGRARSLGSPVVRPIRPVVELNQTFQDAKNKLQQGIDAWDVNILEEARNLFLQCLIGAKEENAILYYYIGLTDYRLATFSLAQGDAASSERWNSEGERYLEKAMASDPAFGESFALYGNLLGLEIALDPEKAMALGMQSMGCLDDALQKDPTNPRIHLLQGIYLLYVPEEYGGGPDRAQESIDKAARLFEKEKAGDSLKPDWGRDEAYAYLGIIHKRKGDTLRAREFLEKAISVNPKSGLAKKEMADLERHKPA